MEITTGQGRASMVEPSLTQEKVLVVDDEEDLCRLLVFNLREAGFHAESALTGTSGFQLASEMRPQVVVLDLMLPDIPGTEVCRRLRADPSLADMGIIM